MNANAGGEEEEPWKDQIVPTTMVAVQVHEFGPPSVMRCQPAKVPTPGRGEVLISMRAAGINPVETYIRSGKYAKLPTLPFTPGGEGAGFVEGVGEGVTSVKRGDRVYIAGCKTGSYAQYTLCDQSTVYPLPANVSFKQGACMGTAYATAHRALFRAVDVRRGERVLVHGATGGVGLAAVQLAKANGCIVYGTGGTEEGRALALSAGCEHVFDHKAEGYLEKILELSGGKGVDVIVELLANVNLGKDLTALAYGGRVAVVGSRGPVEINPRDLMQREAFVVGVANAFQHSVPEEAAEMHHRFYDGLSSGVLSPIVDSQVFTLYESADAHERVASSKGSQGKIVLTIRHAFVRTCSADSTTVDADMDDLQP